MCIRDRIGTIRITVRRRVERVAIAVELRVDVQVLRAIRELETVIEQAVRVLGVRHGGRDVALAIEEEANELREVGPRTRLPVRETPSGPNHVGRVALVPQPDFQLVARELRLELR